VDWSVSPAAGTFSLARTPGDGATSTVFTAGSAPGACTVTATPVEPAGIAASSALTLVDPASVTVSAHPSATVATLGQAVALAATVTPLTDTSVTWTASGGTFNGASWSSAVPGTFTLTATSNGAPTRSATAQVQVVDLGAVALVLSPAAATLLPGAAATFTASGDLGFGVDWSLTAPAVQACQGLTATVTAPAAVPLATATYTLTACHKLDAARKATATITVKGMDLSADGALDPKDLLTFAGEWGKGPASPANFKGAGTVDEADLTTLLNQIK
jgi:hypothetical protein